MGSINIMGQKQVELLGLSVVQLTNSDTLKITRGKDKIKYVTSRAHA
jgi:hypothetical protein